MSTATQGLYKDAYERDSCGFGLIANLDDQPSHWLVRTAILSLNRLTHRGAIAGELASRLSGYLVPRLVREIYGAPAKVTFPPQFSVAN